MSIESKILEKLNAFEKEYAEIVEKMKKLDKEFGELNARRIQVEASITSLREVISNDEEESDEN